MEDMEGGMEISERKRGRGAQDGGASRSVSGKR